MKKEILEYIDTLIEMSGSTNSYENLHEEYLTLTQDIDNKKNQLKNLKRSIGSSKYMKSNEKIIDENVKIGMENRLANYRDSLDDLLGQIADISSTEEKVHNDVVAYEGDLSQLNRYMESLELKMKTSHSKNQTYQNYQSLLDEAYQEKSSIEKQLSNAQKKYSEITKSLAMLGTQRADLEEKISFDEGKLREIEAMLANPTTYIDQKAKKNDEELIDRYNKELEELEQRKIEVITDPCYIGHEAQELYLDHDFENCLAKIKELVTIVESKPYMNVSVKEIDSLLADAEQKRDEFANEIENKRYDGSDLSILQTRISYLEHEIENLEEEKKRIEALVLHIDTEVVPELVSLVSESKKTRDSLKMDIDSYLKVLEENSEMKSPKKRASMQAALKRKQDELLLVERILYHFEQDLESKIIQSKQLEEEEFYSKKIEELKKEIASIKKDIALNSRGKDILAVEKDKEELKGYNDLVSALQHRKKYLESPKDILKKIEHSLDVQPALEEKIDSIDDTEDMGAFTIDYLPDEMANPSFDVEKKENRNLETDNPVEESKEELVSLDDIFSKEDETLKVEAADNSSIDVSSTNPSVESQNVNSDDIEDLFPNPEVEPETFDFPNLENIPFDDSSLEKESLQEEGIIPAISTIEDVKEFPPRTSISLDSNPLRHKVVHVEDLSLTENKEEEKPNVDIQEDDVMVNDFEDTDYISFNDLLDGGFHEN